MNAFLIWRDRQTSYPARTPCPFGPPDLSPLTKTDYDGANFFEKLHIVQGVQPNGADPYYYQNRMN